MLPSGCMNEFPVVSARCTDGRRFGKCSWHQMHDDSYEV